MRIQPGNTIWLPSKNAWTLIDFGCASRTGEAADLSFSLWYAPPELIVAYTAGERTLVADPSADVWSLGVRFNVCSDYVCLVFFFWVHQASASCCLVAVVLHRA